MQSIKGLLCCWFPMAITAPTTPATDNTTDSKSSSSTHTASDIITNLTNLLPTGTFTAFQAVAPLFTNNGACGNVEKICTGILIVIFFFIIFILSFTDSISTTSGKHYYGLVTCKGLYNPQFKGSSVANVSGSTYTGDPRRYKVTIFDFINAALGIMVFAVLVLLTPPVSTCYYPQIPNTIVKALPILVGIVASMYFSFAPPPRRGVGYSVTGLVPGTADDIVSDAENAKAGAPASAQPLLTKEEQKNTSASTSPIRAAV